MSVDQPDDLDRLFAHLERAPVPPDLSSRVLARTVNVERRGVLHWPWLVAGFTALTLLTVTGYQLGASLAAGDGLLVLGALLTDIDLLITAPGDVLLAVGEVLPWKLVVLAAVSAAFLVWTAGKLVTQPSLHRRPVV